MQLLSWVSPKQVPCPQRNKLRQVMSQVMRRLWSVEIWRNERLKLTTKTKRSMSVYKRGCKGTKIFWRKIKWSCAAWVKAVFPLQESTCQRVLMFSCIASKSSTFGISSSRRWERPSNKKLNINSSPTQSNTSALLSPLSTTQKSTKKQRLKMKRGGKQKVASGIWKKLTLMSTRRSPQAP